ncbi:MAG: transposase [Planctomycetes bacterium]|nr:transposase [Planctomycetota bacterium]
MSHIHSPSHPEIDRYWFLTWTTYGSWLPGDERGFVAPVRTNSGESVVHNIPGTEYDADIPNLQRFAAAQLQCDPIRLASIQAEALLGQFHETARHRQWKLLAVAIMANHIHIVVGVPGDPKPSNILRDFKSYGSGQLNRKWPRPTSETWWTESGSKRKLIDDDSVFAAVQYHINQEYPLVIWTAEIPELGLKEGRIV